MSGPLFKFLRDGRIAPFSGAMWPDSESRRWLRVQGGLRPCVTGLHVCRIQDLPYWLNDELWEVEVDGASTELTRKVVVEQARLRSRVAWWPASGWEFARDCVGQLYALSTGELEVAGYDGLPPTSDLAEIGRLAGDRLAAFGDRVPEGPGHLLGLLGDAVTFATDRASGPAAAARHTSYVAAFAADRATRSRRERLPRGVTPFTVERARQVGWFRTRLGVEGGA